MKYLSFGLALLFMIISIKQTEAQTNKKTLSHNEYAQWKNIENEQISADGNWVSCEINPARGDGKLYLFNAKKKHNKVFERAKKAVFSPESNYLAFRIYPEFDTIRALKIAKTKKDKLPKDSLFVYLMDVDSSQKFEKLKSFKVPKDGGDWMAILHDGLKPPADTTKPEPKDSTKKEIKKPKKKKKEKGNRLVLLNPTKGLSHSFEKVEEYSISDNGQLMAFIQTVGDSIDSVKVAVFDGRSEQLKYILQEAGTAKKICLDSEGKQAAFLFSADTSKQKIYSLYSWAEEFAAAQKIIDSTTASVPKGWCVSENGHLGFSKDGSKLWYTTAPIPPKETKDSLMKDEIARLDVWSWTDDRLQPQQLKNKAADLKKSYAALWHIKEQKSLQLCDEALPNLQLPFEGNGNYTLGINPKPYQKLQSWDTWYQDYYIVDLNTGERKLLLQKQASGKSLSPDGKYFVWYDQADSSWKSQNTSNGDQYSLTSKLSPVFYNEKHNMPVLPGPYGLAGWSKNDDFVYIYDRFDIWKIDPEMEQQPQLLTNGYGKKHKVRLRYRRLNRDINTIPEHIILSGFDETSKESAFFSLNTKDASNPKTLIKKKAEFRGIKKARNAEEIIWRMGDVQHYPELYISNIQFKKERELTNTNPQQEEFNWMTEELVSWTSSDGVKLEGLLYKPEDFDSTKKYPMLVYFYETYSENLYRHYIPSPSRSVINFPYFTSNGYLIFIPDIVYGTGYPGQDAYNAIVSGTLEMMDRPYVDNKHIGIQGQSWGGYQVAYLVTQTNLYAAAEAGAPVSNMTSAYGGIRWASGMSRMFQYENTQSRIGGTLWEKPMQYLANSPVFMADKVQTPLLIMHNDNDGAVPWYQGIEMFVAMRRLNKPCWMLTYNGDSHNLKKENWGNRMDLSKRLQQFFDHYLKEKPAPKWMIEGVPAIDKGVDYGFDLE